MGKPRNYAAVIGCSVVMLAWILDSKTALIGASDAVSLCIKTVIPSLFPMMVLSSILTDQIAAHPLNSHTFLSRVLGIPPGCEGILAPALLGGYPVGAACIASHYRAGNISRKDAERLLYFCSNAGPSFIFGLCCHMFTKSYAVWLIWLIQIVSALMTGLFTFNTPTNASTHNASTHPITEVVKNAVNNIGLICGWIILFRVLIQFLNKWLLWIMPAPITVVISGVLELTNGCCMLDHIAAEPMRFILCSFMLSLGGLCVLLQTAAVIAPLPLTSYWQGKLTQTMFSLFLSIPTGLVLYSQLTSYVKLLVIIAILIIPLFLLHFIKKMIAFSDSMQYNSVEVCRKR